MTALLATALVDGHALLQLIYVALIAGIGICSVYALVVIGITRSSEHRKARRGGAAAAYGALAVAGLAVCAWAIVTGITVMASK